jgi:hypothetical protein
MTFDVNVVFTGTVQVLVPKSVPKERRADLAEKKALAVVLATLDNPDAPEDDACAEYQENNCLTDAKANKEWDATQCDNVCGSWTSLDVYKAAK